MRAPARVSPARAGIRAQARDAVEGGIRATVTRALGLTLYRRLAWMELRLDVRPDWPAALVPLDARRVGYDEVGRIGWVGIGRLRRPFRTYRDDLATGRGRRFSRQTE